MKTQQYNLYKSSVFLFILFILTAIVSPKTFATTQLGSSNKTKTIIGHPPFMQSIGAHLSLSEQTLYDENQLPVLTVGSELFIPSIFCKGSLSETDLSSNDLLNNDLLNNDLLNNELSKTEFSKTLKSYSLDNHFFMFADQDNDLCLSAKHESQLVWFALDAGQQDWSSIQAWGDLTATVLNDDMHLIPAGTLAQSPYTQGLQIPAAAIGKRIGFTYSPLSTTGNPNSGNPIKVWDISYFFGQEKYDLAAVPAQENKGKRLDKIALNASFSEVVENRSKPKIENLIMKGTFLPNFQLTAEYDFIANTESNSGSENQSEDVSRFWWGEAGTTATQAYFQNPDYQTTHQSPILTMDDVAKIYSVSVLPIKKESVYDSTYYVVGDVVSITSDNPNNQFTQPSSIRNLQFSNALNIDTTISATYLFEKGDPIAEDHSEYTWSYIDTEGKSHLLANDKIKESGKVPNSPRLTLEQSGLTLMLEMLPKDQFNRIGDTVPISANIETAQFIAEPNIVKFTLKDTNPSSVSVTAKYASGSKDITSIGTWSSNDESVATVDNQGNIMLNPNLSTEATGSITFSYLEHALIIDVNVEALPPSISNLRFISILENDELAVFDNQGATYDYHNGGKLNSTDKSTFTWKIKNENSVIGSGTITKEGVVPFPTSSSPIFHSGKVVELEVIPKDNFDRTGQSQTAEAKLEEIKGVEVEPSPLEIKRQTTAQLYAYALFSGGRKRISPMGNTAFDGVWKANSTGITISYSGYVTAAGNPTTGTITYTYLGFSVEIPFTVVE